jgi:hypothetical protein
VGDGAAGGTGVLAGAGVVAGEAAAVASFLDLFFGVALAAGVALVTGAAGLGAGLVALCDLFLGDAEAAGVGLTACEYASGEAAIANRARSERNLRIQGFYLDSTPVGNPGSGGKYDFYTLRQAGRGAKPLWGLNSLAPNKQKMVEMRFARPVTKPARGLFS